jgi:hypothetical protein
VPDDLLAQKNVSTIEEIRREEPASADHGCATIIRHACTPTERPPGGQMAQCASLIAPYASVASPAGLTTQVGFIRLAHLKCPKSGKPDFGWSIIFAKTSCEEDGLPGQARQ